MSEALQYFGTDLTNSGHGFMMLEGGRFGRSRAQIGDFPFNAEMLPYKPKGYALANGAARFYRFAGFSIYAIEGSCVDSRRGSKSIFFVEERLDKEQLKARILATPIASRIIQQMPFEVKW